MYSRIKILHYNIDHGGREGKDIQARWPRIIRVIQSVNPDIVILLEAWGWREKRELKKFNKKLRFPYVSLSQSHTPHHIALLSRLKPLKVVKYRKGLHHSAISAVFENASGTFSLFAIHLSPKTETQRLNEAQKILKLVKPQSRTVVLGDYNSLSLLDHYNARKLLHELRRRKIKKFGTKTLQRKVIALFLRAGLIDIIKKLHQGKRIEISVPTKKISDVAHVIPLRLDYAFVSKDFESKISRAEFIRNSLTHFASDHYPLLLEIKEKTSQ